MDEKTLSGYFFGIKGDRAKRMVGQSITARVRVVKRPGQVLALTLPLPKRRHAELQQHHGSSRHPISARRKTPDARQPPPAPGTVCLTFVAVYPATPWDTPPCQ